MHLKPKLTNMNIWDMSEEAKALKGDLDIDGNEQISLREICGVLGFERDSLTPHNQSHEGEALDPFDSSIFVEGAEVEVLCRSKWRAASIISPEIDGNGYLEVKLYDEDITLRVLKKELRESKIHRSVHKAHERLRRNPMLQEAVVDLLDRLLHKDPSFLAMQANNKSKAESYLRRQRSHAEKALRRIREDPDRSLQMGVNYTKSNHQIDGRRQLLSRSDRGMSDLKEERQVDGHEWDAIMNRIFLEKFF